MGAIKNDKGKPQLSLLPRVFLEETARAFELGQSKYGRYNYESGLQASRLVDALLRHVAAFNSGEDEDPESGYSHLGHAAANIAMLLRTKELGTLKDDRRPVDLMEPCLCEIEDVKDHIHRWNNPLCKQHNS